jgi:glycine/D-amino acid oxidase-like deaminating enzyme
VFANHHICYIIPRKDGQLLIGSTMEDVGFDRSTDKQVGDALLAFATERSNAMSNCPKLGLSKLSRPKDNCASETPLDCWIGNSRETT